MQLVTAMGYRLERFRDERLAFDLLHGRVLAGDVEAAEEIADRLLAAIRPRVRRAKPWADSSDVETAIEDTVLAYLAQPGGCLAGAPRDEQAAALGIAHLPVGEQRTRMNAVWELLTRRLERRGLRASRRGRGAIEAKGKTFRFLLPDVGNRRR